MSKEITRKREIHFNCSIFGYIYERWEQILARDSGNAVHRDC